MNHEGAIAELEREVRQLEIDYNRYFAGALELPPELFRKDLAARLRQLRAQPITGTAERFRLSALTDRFNTLSEHFTRKLRELEAGLLPRRPASETAPDPHQGIVLDGGAPSPEAVQALYEAMCGGQSESKPFPAFRDALLRQLDQLRATHACSRIRLRVDLAEGRPRLRARPVEEAP